MKRAIQYLLVFLLLEVVPVASSLLYGQPRATNPIIFADVPDISIIRVGKVYYMSSTTMHMSPGLPIMKSNDLLNWKLIGYAYDTLAQIDDLALTNGKNSYGRGSWASSLRYNKGTYYVSTFAQTTGKTYVFSTRNIEKGGWKVSSFKPSYHDHSLFFDDDGRVYMVYGAGEIKLLELEQDASKVKAAVPEKIIISNASKPAGDNINLKAEGSQLFKVNGKYYLFNIVWPKQGMRTAVVHRADKITGPYEGRLALQDLGVAQGGLIDTPDGKWFAYLFRDYGSVGRIPYLVPVNWVDGWPVVGVNGKVPVQLDLNAENQSLIPGIVDSDDFDQTTMKLVWQWNHNPDDRLWSLKERRGFLRLKTGRIDTSILTARNTLTQRTIGPRSNAITSLDISGMNDGDFAGLCLLQKKFGLVGVKREKGVTSIVMINGEKAKPLEVERINISQKKIYFKAACDFTDMIDTAKFYYSIDGNSWTPIGSSLKMSYTLPHFMGYRFGLFNFATEKAGGIVDFDFMRIEESKK